MRAAVADKIMVATALVLLTTSPPFPIGPGTMALPVAIMISREISMSALREWAAASSADAHDAVKVNTFGKWKTALQVCSMEGTAPFTGAVLEGCDTAPISIDNLYAFPSCSSP